MASQRTPRPKQLTSVTEETLLALVRLLARHAARQQTMAIPPRAASDNDMHDEDAVPQQRSCDTTHGG
jgi:hypothetical protein